MHNSFSRFWSEHFPLSTKFSKNKKLSYATLDYMSRWYLSFGVVTHVGTLTCFAIAVTAAATFTASSVLLLPDIPRYKTDFFYNTFGIIFVCLLLLMLALQLFWWIFKPFRQYVQGIYGGSRANRTRGNPIHCVRCQA